MGGFFLVFGAILRQFCGKYPFLLSLFGSFFMMIGLLDYSIRFSCDFVMCGFWELCGFGGLVDAGDAVEGWQLGITDGQRM